MLTHEEVFTSPFPSPSRTRGRTRFALDYERSPPSNYMNGGSMSQTPGSHYRRSGTVPVQVTPVAAPSFTNGITNGSGVKISAAANDSIRTSVQHHNYSSHRSSHRKEGRERRELNVPYDATLNASTSTVRPLTTVFTHSSGSNTTKETTPPQPEPHPPHSSETERYLRKTERRRREATERVIGEEDFRRLQASLESLQKTLKQTRSLLRESEKSSEWWKERVKVLDKRSRGLEVDNRALGSRVAALEEENRLLREERELAAKASKEREEEEKQREKEREEERERERSRVLQEKSFQTVNGDHGKENHSGIIESVMASEGNEKSNKKDKMYTDAIRSLISQYWNMQTTLAVGATGTEETDGVCDCAAARAVQSILLHASAPSTSKNSSAKSPIDASAPSVVGGIDGDVNMDIDIDKPKEPVVRIPPHPHPEIFSNLRRVRKKVLRKRVKEMKGYIETLRGENEVLEKVILERDGGVGMDLAADFDVTKL